MAASSAVASELMQFADESHFTPDFQRHAQSPRPVRKNSGALHSLEKKKMHRGSGSLVRLSQLTSGKPAATREAFNLRRSYLGAITTLEARIGSVK